jgi:hypothetical protein
MPSTYEPIATTTLGSATTTITFSSIPATYTDLRLVLVARAVSTSISVDVRFNSDSGSNYSKTILYGDGTAAQSGRTTSQTQIGTNYGSAFDATNPGLLTMDLFSYAGSTNKTVLFTVDNDLNGSGETQRTVALWRNTSAINTIAMISSANQFKIGTTATLYGIKNA